MSLHLRLVLPLGLVLVTPGCAYLTNYTRAIELDRSSYSLDVKQRVVFSQERIVNGEFGAPPVTKRVICAEPSPDALTVISASAGVAAANAVSSGLSRSNERSDASSRADINQGLNVSAALAEQGAFIGLRTQSIQLLRDTMYRLCEGYAAGAIGDEEFTAMQRRYQSTMMGLLAIEQLTRPVVAAQVVLASNSAAQSGASAGDSSVDKAQARLDEKVAEDVNARVDLDKAQTDERASRKALDDNSSQSRAVRSKAERDTAGDAEAKKAAGEEAAKPFAEARVELEATHSANQQKSRAAGTRAAATASAKAAAERDLQLAKARTGATAGGAGTLGAMREASAQMTADLTAGVKEVVSEINKSYMRDSCFSLVASLVRQKSQSARETQLSEKAIEACVGIIQNEQERIRLETEQFKQRSEIEREQFKQRSEIERDRRQAAIEDEKAYQRQRLESLEADTKIRQMLIEAQAQRAAGAQVKSKDVGKDPKVEAGK